jgi:CBS domain-containing protein
METARIAPAIRDAVRAALKPHAPFASMSAADLDDLVAHLSLAYFPAGSTLLEAGGGVADYCYIIKQGSVAGLQLDTLGKAAEQVAELLEGECFPVGALLAERPVSLRYVARSDVFCWLLPRAEFGRLTRQSQPFLDFCTRRIGALLDISRQQLQAVYANSRAEERALSRPLGDLAARPALSCGQDTPLRKALELMHARGRGSIIVLDEQGKPAGIFTRTDVIGRIVLPGLSLDTPVSEVMSRPVQSLSTVDTAADAALLMARHTIRHLPVMEDGQLVGVVSERDLFALQRLSLRSIGESIRSAETIDDLSGCARDIRDLSRNLVAQGLAARQITRLISHLNDRLTQRLVALGVATHGMDPARFVWLALGSEGRHEQTISTDQDNGLIFLPRQAADLERPAWLAMARWINKALDRCGYPLCKGEIMASNPRWCLSMLEWEQLFARWIDQGDPKSLLGASIFFDFRPVAGNERLGEDLAGFLRNLIARNPRFLKQMAVNALQNQPPASWSGNLLDTWIGDRSDPIDLKLQGTVPFVDAARILALAHGISESSTSDRLAALTELGAVPAEETRAWIESFEFLQLMRLRAQLGGEEGEQALRQAGDSPNTIRPGRLSVLDRRILKEAFRQARKLQQRLELDYR